ncbi:porin [Methylopila capsulata]|uniref:Porin n=1 Tax=Methylopila capsulata TaxID=61654 RepID=A0A9W6MRQ3_9HYPH|nr:carbohydrate porin [Methylopila capsulata]MBM7850191.1 porin [Methylopila capsulata]GLK55483.1 porin [Methylopila capsulata]
MGKTGGGWTPARAGTRAGGRTSAAAACGALLALAASGVSARAADATATEAASSFWGDLFEREKLTGDWGGARTKLEDAGVTLEANYTIDYSRNLSGGVSKGEGYSSLFQISVDLDLEKLAGWQGGAFHAGGYVIRGPGLTGHEVGNLLTMSNIEYDRAERLAEVYFKQSLLDDRLEVKIGQLAADGDFATSDTAGLFVNSTFGWPGLNGVDLAGGGPAYPVPTPGVHVAYKIDDAFSVQGGVYNGDPLGGHDENEHGLNFPVKDGVFMIGELAYAYAPADGSGGLPGVYKIGGWYTSANFDDLRRASNGLSLADPAADGPRRRDGNYALYGVVDQTVWQSGDLKNPQPSSISVFVRAVIAPESDRSLIDRYFDAGVNFKGFVPSRPDDLFGVAVGYAHVSNHVRKLDRDAIALGEATPKHSSEIAIEASYQAAIAPWLKVQPFVQYIVRPGGGDPDSDRPAKRLKNATLIGFRTSVDF